MPVDSPSILPTDIDSFVEEVLPVFAAIVGIVIYSTFVFKFYRFLASKDLIDVDFSQYSEGFTGFLKRFVDGILVIIQYILFTPFLISFWTLILAVILTLLSGGDDLYWNVLVATSMVGSVRVISYFSEDLSRDVAKMLPFAVLGVFLVDSGSFNWSAVSALWDQLDEFAFSFGSSMVLVAILETLLRILDTLRQIISPPDPSDEFLSNIE
ncbi:MAG: hypothetical protein QF722_06750 [Candidatus Thalassarchaeaceae archaeon]|nr:hypothetical protein [Candidatus Thalassarchaeaceae archaeon]MDP6845228.1 hypothetical protein [Candidatus Thalassarchaeaceae archaeon]